MKEMGNPGRLTMATRRDEKRQLLVSVTGTGVGLPPGHAEQIFNTFFTSNPKAPVWDCRSADRLLNRTAAGYWPPPTPGRAQPFNSPCLSKPLHAGLRNRPTQYTVGSGQISFTRRVPLLLFDVFAETNCVGLA
jgi:hypothetical protein